MKNLSLSIIVITLITLGANAQIPDMTGTWIAADNPNPAVFVQYGSDITFTNNLTHVGAGYWVSPSRAKLIQTFTAGGCSEDMYLIFNAVTNNLINVTYQFLENKCGNVAGTTGQTTITRQVVTTVPVGESPTSAAVNLNSNKIYVSNHSSNSVSVIDGASFATTNISVVPNNARLLGVDPVTNKIYATNNQSDTNNLSIINGNDNSVKTFTAGTNPFSLVVNSSADMIYVCNPASVMGNSSVIAINGRDDSMTAIPLTFRPVFIAINEQTNKIYISDGIGGAVKIINANNHNSMQSVAIPNAGAIAVDTMTGKTYVANTLSAGAVTVINADNSLSAPIAAGVFPAAIAVNSKTHKIYVVNSGTSTAGGSVTIIDGRDNSVSNIVAGASPGAVAVNSATDMIYVVNTGSNNVTVIDGSSGMAVATIPVGASPISVSINELTNKIYVTNADSNTVSIIDGNAIVSTNGRK